MKIEGLIKEKQPNVYIKLDKKKHVRGNREDLSFSDIENLMKHSSYKRVNGAIRQVRY